MKNYHARRLPLRVKREEANDIIQSLLPLLEEVGIERDNCKFDTTTSTSGQLRGDVWISSAKQGSRFESNIIGLIEAKHHNCALGDIEWRDAMAQGQTKASLHHLNYYIVSNCKNTHRFYNSLTNEEISIDGLIATKLQAMEVLRKLQAQITASNSSIFHNFIPATGPISENEFRSSLQNLANIYRSCGLKKGDERIDPTVSFVVLKYIGEKESHERTLAPEVKLWDDYGRERGNYAADFSSSKADIFSGEHGDTYLDFRDLVRFPTKLRNDHYRQIYNELSKYHFHGSTFDVFGAIYEEFASTSKKKEFGEFYTRRHITGVVARLLLRKENVPRPLRICDPACGSGGFLTEAFKTLMISYAAGGLSNNNVQKRLKTGTFWGLDNDETSVARTKLNMFLVGDGHTHIYHIKDSIVEWNSAVGWDPGSFDYVLANPPMGKYNGEADQESFSFTNERRYELLFAERVLEATKAGGEVALIVPDGMLEAPSRENFRLNLLGSADILAVISLTRFAFAPYTKEKTYILLLQKKQAAYSGQRQTVPIWNYIVDFDGFANSDKRYRTELFNDLPELETLLPGALALARSSASAFEAGRSMFERETNVMEKSAGVEGMKCGFVLPTKVSDDNFHNLLCEFYLREPHATPISKREFLRKQNSIFAEIANLI